MNKSDLLNLILEVINEPTMQDVSSKIDSLSIPQLRQIVWFYTTLMGNENPKEMMEFLNGEIKTANRHIKQDKR